jgi:hypothetical protein
MGKMRMKESETAESHNFKPLPSAAELLALLQAPEVLVVQI